MRPWIDVRDREVTFLRREGTQDSATGAWSYEWVELDDNPTEWAQVQDILPSRAESVVEGISIERRPCRIRLLWRADVTADLRVRVDGRELRIAAGPVELGRRDGLEMVCEALSTEGNEP